MVLGQCEALLKKSVRGLCLLRDKVLGLGVVMDKILFEHNAVGVPLLMCDHG